MRRECQTWQLEITGHDGNVALFGVNIFDYEWQNTCKFVKVRDHLYGQEYNFLSIRLSLTGGSKNLSPVNLATAFGNLYLEVLNYVNHHVHRKYKKRRFLQVFALDVPYGNFNL
jgi:hypothetical protein